MQFYLGGVRGLDPYIAEPSARAQAHSHTNAVSEELAVLNVVCGPTWRG